jgi:hypothetical protein
MFIRLAADNLTPYCFFSYSLTTFSAGRPRNPVQRSEEKAVAS